MLATIARGARAAPSFLMPDQSPVELLRRAIAESGMSTREFATDVLVRDERTVRRWVAGKAAIPRAVVELLESEFGEKR